MKRALVAHFAYVAASLSGPASATPATAHDDSIASRLDEDFLLGAPMIDLPAPTLDHPGERVAVNRKARRAAAARARRRTP